MKKSLVRSFLDGVNDTVAGERYPTILRYFFPELVTNFLLYGLPFWIDSYFIGQLHSTVTYAASGATNTLLHSCTKAAEAFAVATIIVVGQLNGSGDHHGAGRALRTAFWVSCTVGVVLGLALYVGAPAIYRAYGVPPEMLAPGISYLKLRAVGIFLMFMNQACVGFLRGVKNTRIPMIVAVTSSAIFVALDYALIFGKCGFVPLGLNGSALASTVQYACAVALSVAYLTFGPYARSHAISLFSGFGDTRFVHTILSLSWPIVLDKTALTFAYIWLNTMMNPMGTTVVASFCVVREMARFVLIPAVALAQVITFLVSNDIGAGNAKGVKSNVKKVLCLAACITFALMIIFSLFPRAIVQLFDRNDDFTSFSIFVFPLANLLIFFDLAQLTLAGALRGAANVKVVLVVRLVAFLLFFIPVSYTFAHLPLRHDIKFIMIYSSFYASNALMALGYLYQFRSNRWKLPAGIIDG